MGGGGGTVLTYVQHIYRGNGGGGGCVGTLSDHTVGMPTSEEIVRMH